MCGRFALFIDQNSLIEHFDVVDQPSPHLGHVYGMA